MFHNSSTFTKPDLQFGCLAPLHQVTKFYVMNVFLKCSLLSREFDNDIFVSYKILDKMFVEERRTEDRSEIHDTLSH